MGHRVLVHIAIILVAAGCAKRDGGATPDAPPSSPSPIAIAPASANANPTANGAPATSPASPAVTSDETTQAGAPALAPSLPATVDSANVRVTFAPNPEPAGFPTGAFRAATKMCVKDTHLAVTDATTSALELSIHGAHVRAVTSAPSDGGGLPASFVACLQKLYAKVTLTNAPPKLPVTLTLAPGASD